jgi:hypothetical protein
MSAVIGSLRAELSANIAQFQSDMGQAANTLKKFSREAKAVGREIEEVGKSMSLALTLPLVALGTEAVKKANDAARAMALLRATIASTGNSSGKTADQLGETAKQLRAISQYDDEEILQGVTTNLLRFGNVQGPIFDRAQKAIVNLSSALGQDLQSASIKVGRALQDPIKGMQALTRLGITFTSAQKEHVKALVQSGQGMQAQQIILAALEKRFDGAAKALRDATPGAELKNAWEDFGETVGALLVPAIRELASMLSTALKWFNDLPVPLQKFIVGVSALAAVIGPLLAGFGFFIKLGGQIAGLLRLLITPLSIVLGFVASLSAATLAWVAGLAAVAIAIAIFSKSVGDVLHGNFKKAWEDAKNTAASIAGTIKGLWNSVTGKPKAGPDGKPAPGGAGAGGGGGAEPPDFNLDNEDQLKKRVEALKTLKADIKQMGDKITNSLGDITLPKATSQANALNLQIDNFVKKAQDAGVNTAAFAGKIDVLRDRIEKLRQAGLEKEAKAFSENVDSAAVAVDRFARGGLPVLEERLGNVDDAFKQLRDKIQNDIDANAALAASNNAAAEAMERLKGLLNDLTAAHEAARKAAIEQAAAEQRLADLNSQRNQFETRTQIEDLHQARGEGAPITQDDADLQRATRELHAQSIEAAQKLAALERDRAVLVEQNLNHENDEQIANITKEIELQRELARLVGSTSATQIVSANKIADAFRTFTADLSRTLVDMVANWDFSLHSLTNVFRRLLADMLLKPAGDMLSGVLGKVVSGIFGVGGGAAGAAGFAGFFAKGGSLNPGEWGIAGENGPEPIFAGTGGMTIMPHQAGGASGGDIYIDARGADTAAVQRLAGVVGELQRREGGRIRGFNADQRARSR